MATAVSAGYPLPPPALFAGNDSSSAASGTSSQGGECILKKALAEGLPEYLKEGKKLPGTQEEYETQFPPIDGGLEGDLKGAAQKFYDAAKHSAINIHNHTSEFHKKGYQLIFSIPNGISSIADSTKMTYSGLKRDLEYLLKSPPQDLKAGFKFYLQRPQEDFKTLRDRAKKQKENCAKCVTALTDFKPIIENDKAELAPVKTAYNALVPLMQRDLKAKNEEREALEKRINTIKADVHSRFEEARADPTGGSAAQFQFSRELSRLNHEAPEKQAQVDILNAKDKQLKEWNTRLLKQEKSMDGVRRTIDAAITATETIRVAYATMESGFGKILDSFKNLNANMVKTDPKFQRKGLEDLEEAEQQWGKVLEQIKVFIDSKVYE